MLKIEENGSLPDNWSVAALEDVCEILDRERLPVNVKDREKRIAGKNKDQLFPYYGATGQVGWIDDYIFEGEYILIGEDGAPFLDAFKDKAYIVNGRFWVNNHAHILKAYISSNLLCHYLNQIDYMPFVTGTTRLKLNQASMKQIPVAIPSPAEQKEIVAKIEELFSELDSGIESLKKAREQLKTYRQAVLKHAFEGKLTEKWRERQKEAGNPPEPAEKLIERIRKEREAHYKKQVEAWEKECEQAKAEGRKKPAKPKKPKDLPPLTEEELAELPDLPDGWGFLRLGDLIEDPKYGTSKKCSYNGELNSLKFKCLMPQAAFRP
ncbi:MAG: restriction endonuclease subunit S, partial [Desulfosalsimonas sp.]